MVNPMALIIMALGVALLLLGILLAVTRRRVVGIAISLLGLGAAATPFLVSLYLARGGP